MSINKLCSNCFYQKDDAEICPNCGYQQGSPAESPLQLSPGTILGNNYVIGQALGQGGFGITYLSWDMNLNIKLAIKEYFPQQYATRAGGLSQVSAFSGSLGTFYEFGLEKFLQEARTLAKFEGHPNIVSVRNYFEANGTAYLVMRYVEGITLKDHLNNQGGTIPYEQAKALMMPVFDALKEVHAAGILHRDISPDNIFINEKGQVVLLDFGAARQAISEKGKTLSVILKPGYAPEEQYRSKGVQGAWTDVYSLAATFYRLITGWQPPEALERLVEDPIVSPSHMGVDIDDWDERVLLKGLAVRAEDRYQTVEAFQGALLGQEEPEEIAEPPAVTTYTAPPYEEQEIEVTYAAHAPAEPPAAPVAYQQGPTAAAPELAADKEGTKMPISLKKNHLIVIGTVVAVLLLALVGFSIFFGAIEEITFEETSLTLETGGEEYQLTVSVKPLFADKNSLIWSVEDGEESIASVDQGGVVRPLKAGVTTVIVATADNAHRAECLLEVIETAISWEGGSYSGEQLDGTPHGEGSWSHPDGTTYTGQWKNGLFDGSGSWTGADGRKYEGKFAEDLFDGEGTLLTAGGDRYEGQFSRGLYHGQGKFTSADGTIFEGSFVEGKRHGEGKLTLADGTVETGIWEDGVKADLEELAEEKKETEVAQVEESPETAPPSTAAKGTIPNINANVVSFKFFETGTPTATGDYRLYNTRFRASETRFICWQLYLTHPPAEQMRSINLTVTRTVGGSSQVVDSRLHHISAGTSSSDITGVCVGSPNTGTIPPGTYTITIQSGEAGTLASGSFQIN